MTWGIETAATGTLLYERLNAHGRLCLNTVPDERKYGTVHLLLYLLKSMSLDDFIAGLEHLYDRLFATEVLRRRFARSREVLGNLAAAYFAFRVNLDWQHVFRHLIENAKTLRASGEYDRALWQYRQQHASATVA